MADRMSKCLESERKAELRKKLAVMIDLAWRGDEFDPEENLTEPERDYLQDRVDGIIARLHR